MAELGDLGEAMRDLMESFHNSNDVLAIAENQLRMLRHASIAQEGKIEALREEVEALGRELAPIGALTDTVRLMANELSDIKEKLASLNK